MLGESEFLQWFFLSLDVFAKDVDLDVEGSASGEGAETGGLVGMGDDGDFYHVVDDGGDCEADAFDGDGTLGDDVTSEGLGELDAETPIGIGLAENDRREGDQRGGTVDVALNDVATERGTGGSGKFEVQNGVGA